MSHSFSTSGSDRSISVRRVRTLMFGACLLPLATSACSNGDGSEPAPPSEDAAPINTAFYVTMRDGVRIAVDLWVPADASERKPVPTILRATTYWREQQAVGDAPETNTQAEAKAFARGGYAQVIVDARGSGSSFGTRPHPWSADEVADYGEIVDYIVAQPWSNGSVGAFGTSYDGNTAEMIGTLGKDAVRAVVPRFAFPNVYEGVVFPGGIFNQGFVQSWFEFTGALDANDVCALASLSGPDCEMAVASGAGVKAVDVDADRTLRAAALAEHETGPDQYAGVRSLANADDLWNGADFAAISPGFRGRQAELTQTPFMAWAGWMDVGTAHGALNRWAGTDVPMVVVIGPWGHDAAYDANPYQPKDAILEMPQAEQHELTLEFFDHYLKPEAEPAPLHEIVYFTLGENVWKKTPVWPPAGTTMTALYLRQDHALSAALPAAAELPDDYTVDFTASTGEENGWWTKLASADVYPGDRRAEDEKLLLYTSAPLDVDTEITGHPQVTLYLSSTESDGALFVYLEDVAPDGGVTYITEGELRLVHRKLCARPSTHTYGPCRTFAAEDAEPVPPGVVQEVVLGLNPISVLLRAGHSIRVAVAGHDASTFARIPAEGTPRLSVSHDPQHPSKLELPIVAR